MAARQIVTAGARSSAADQYQGARLMHFAVADHWRWLQAAVKFERHKLYMDVAPGSSCIMGCATMDGKSSSNLSHILRPAKCSACQRLGCFSLLCMMGRPPSHLLLLLALCLLLVLPLHANLFG